MGVDLYDQMVERNLGIWDAGTQQRIRDARVVIIGCGGIGGVVALALARTGLGHFVLYDHDVYSPTNLNRQINCYTDTLGVNKAISIADAIHRINPDAEVDVCPRALTAEELPQVIPQGDVFMPAADEWPLSIAALNMAKEMGKPAIMAYPVGALTRVCTFLPASPYAAECLVMPYKADYAELKGFMDSPAHRSALDYYCTEGGWNQSWFDEWCESKRPHAQLCFTVWITGSLAAMEIIKLVSGRWAPVVAPRYWHITPTGARIAKFSLARRLLSRQVRNPAGQKLLPFLRKHPVLLRLFTRAIS